MNIVFGSLSKDVDDGYENVILRGSKFPGVKMSLLSLSFGDHNHVLRITSNWSFHVDEYNREMYQSVKSEFGACSAIVFAH